MKKLLLIILISTVLLIACKKDGDNNDTTSNNLVNTPPKASFNVIPNSGDTLTNFLFNASGCSDNEDAEFILQVRWDFEGDGIWDVNWNSNKIINHQFKQKGYYPVLLEVRDSLGLTDTTFQIVTVTNGGIYNHPPGSPSNPTPPDSAIGQLTHITLSWTCIDPDQDSLSFNFYFGDTLNPVLVQSGITINSFDQDSLDENTTYYWRIVAMDNKGGITSGPIWRFITANNSTLCLNKYSDHGD